MARPRHIRPLTTSELRHLTVERLLSYRKQALCLENSFLDSDYVDQADSLNKGCIYFKDDPRWEPLYKSILAELAFRQSGDTYSK